MAAPTVTYTFVNNTTADATQVNQNFTDVLNALSDGSKDLTFNDLTVNGTAILGATSADDLSINASLASTIPIKTTFNYDIGSVTVGLRALYLGSSDSAAKSVNLRAGVIGTSYTYTFPTSGGGSRYRQLSNGSGVNTYEDVRGSYALHNYSIVATVAASALTVALKGADGNNASSTNIIEIGFRNVTSATGTPVQRTVTGALSVVISSGSTLGQNSAKENFIYVYALDNAGTVELAISSSYFDNGTVLSTTAEGGAGAADLITGVYSTTARTSVPVRLLARLRSTQTTAGTWAVVPTEVSLLPFSTMEVGKTSTNLPLAPSAAAFGTVSNNASTIRRVGDHAEFMGTFACGTVAAAPAKITLPAGMTLDNNKLFATGKSLVGFFVRLDDNTSATFVDEAAPGFGVCFTDTSDTSNVYITFQSTNTGIFDVVNGSESFFNGDIINYRFSIPITEWA